MSDQGVPVDEVTAKDFIMVRAALVKRLGGANEALVWSRIYYRCDEDSRVAHEHEGERWWAAPVRTVAAETGLSEKQARLAIDNLFASGFVLAEQHRLSSNYDQTYSYRPVILGGQIDLPSGANEAAPQGNSELPYRANAPSTETSIDVSTKTGAAKRGSRIPQPFIVTPEMVVWARERTPLVDGRKATERFENHFLAATGQVALKRDWERTWRNWLLKDQDEAERRGVRGKPSPSARALATMALGDELEAERRAVSA